MPVTIVKKRGGDLIVTLVSPLQAAQASSELPHLVFTSAESPAQVSDFFFQLCSGWSPASARCTGVGRCLLLRARRQGLETQVRGFVPGVRSDPCQHNPKWLGGRGLGCRDELPLLLLDRPTCGEPLGEDCPSTGVRHMWHHQVPKLGERCFIHSERIARVAA